MLLASILALLAAGCSTFLEGPEQIIIPTNTPSPSPSPTITVQWFPATPTPEPVQPVETQTPLDMKPGIGEVLLSDHFVVESHWNLGRSQVGSMALGNEDLTLAISQPKGLLLTLRDAPIFDDFELSINSEASLCKNNDHYGIVFRANSYQDYYRFMVSCAGMIRLDRVRSGVNNTLYNWTPSGNVPPGAPVSLKLGVWALGHEMRFFINDTFQFSIRDEAFTSGRVGLYARSTEATALTISFSHLLVHGLDKEAVEKSMNTITPTITATERP